MSWRLWTPPAIMALFLIAVSQYSPLGFHTLAELFAIVISFVMFALAWSTRSFSTNNFLLFLACGYFAIGSLDLMHTLVYKGMNVFVEGSGNYSVQFWIGARYSEALLLLAAPFAAQRKQNGYLLVAVFGAIAVGLSTLILSGNFPTGFIEGKGLTDFKVYSEYLIIAILALALIALLRYGSNISKTEKTLIAASIVMTMCAELVFTFYIVVHGFSNQAGHIFKLFSFWVIFQAIIISNLRRPYIDLKNNRDQLTSTQFELRKLFQAVEQSAASVVITNTDGNIEYVNHRFTKVTGYSREEIIGQNHRFIKCKYTSPDEYKGMYQAINSGKEWSGEFSTKRKDGTIYWGVASISPIRNEEGTIISFLTVTEDISERKTLEQQLRRTQKMEAIGELTGGIAHDFNNLLGIIIGNLDLMDRKIEDGSKLGKQLEKARNAAFRGSVLTRRLLSFSRQSPEPSSAVELNKIISGLEDLLAKSLTNRICLEIVLADDLWMVEIDTGDFEDALVNIMLNARDAMPDGGRLIIETKNTVLDRIATDSLEGLEPGEYVEIVISDTGSGMPKGVSDKIFDPFFTTKIKDNGTGLGMAMVYGFSKRSKGHISVSSEEGVGTTFRIYLPRSLSMAVQTKSPPETDVSLPRGTETVLIVDDEEELTAIAEGILEELGYTTICAHSGDEALQVLGGNDSIDLVFSDIVMPGLLSGFDLADTATKTYPGLKVLLTSGFKVRGRMQNPPASEKWVNAVISKPYRDVELAKRVRATLDEGN